MIRLTETENEVTFTRDSYDDDWGDCSDGSLLKRCNREDRRIKRVQFQDDEFIGSVLQVYFEHTVDSLINTGTYTEELKYIEDMQKGTILYDYSLGDMLWFMKNFHIHKMNNDSM